MSRLSVVDRWRGSAPQILPSLLLCDFAHLADEIRRLEAAGVTGMHLDVMDGHFVPNLTYGMTIVEAVRGVTELPLDVHLMIEQPERFVDHFCRVGADSLTVHVEATKRPRDVLQQIKSSGAAAGIALNPATPLTAVEPCLEEADLVLVMSVPAGFGGQSFHPEALDKLRWLREHAAPELLLEVDGGVGPETIGQCAQAGAQLFVVGSAIFRHADYAVALGDLRQRMAVT